MKNPAPYLSKASLADALEISESTVDEMVRRGVLPKPVKLSVLGRLWPWDFKWWKPEKRRRNLIKAAALLVAEVERIDRFEAKKKNAA